MPEAPVPLAGLSVAARERLRALNNAHAEMTSYLSEADWARLVGSATLALALPGGFVVAHAPDAAHDSVNFLWFRKRFERFLYVDRIVVDPAARGQGTGRRLYAHVAAHARAHGLGRVVCEVNRVPPNPDSDAFHAALGFVPLATVTVSPAKSVRYLALECGPPAPPAAKG